MNNFLENTLIIASPGLPDCSGTVTIIDYSALLGDSILTDSFGLWGFVLSTTLITLFWGMSMPSIWDGIKKLFKKKGKKQAVKPKVPSGPSGTPCPVCKEYYPSIAQCTAPWCPSKRRCGICQSPIYPLRSPLATCVNVRCPGNR